MEEVGAAKPSKPIKQPKSTESAHERIQRARPHPKRATARVASPHETNRHPLFQRKPQTAEEKMRGKLCPKQPSKSPNSQSESPRWMACLQKVEERCRAEGDSWTLVPRARGPRPPPSLRSWVLRNRRGWALRAWRGLWAEATAATLPALPQQHPPHTPRRKPLKIKATGQRWNQRCRKWKGSQNPTNPTLRMKPLSNQRYVLVFPSAEHVFECREAQGCCLFSSRLHPVHLVPAPAPALILTLSRRRSKVKVRSLIMNCTIRSVSPHWVWLNVMIVSRAAPFYGWGYALWSLWWWQQLWGWDAHKGNST